MKVRNILMTGLVMVFCASIAMAGPGERDHEKMFKKLNLSDTQIQAMKDLRKAKENQSETARKEMKAAHEALRNELNNETPDAAKIAQIKEKMKTAQAKMIDLRVDSLVQTRKILTAEQFKKLGENREHNRKDRDRFHREE